MTRVTISVDAQRIRTLVLDAQFGMDANYQGELRSAIWKLIAAMEMLAISIDASPTAKARSTE